MPKKDVLEKQDRDPHKNQSTEVEREKEAPGQAGEELVEADGQTPAPQLGSKQLLAIALLASGMSVVDTARNVGVDPSTVHRWLSGSFHFQAKLNRAREELLGAAQHHLVAASVRAAENVVGEIANGDPAISLKVLDRLGVLAPPTMGPTDHIATGLGAVHGEFLKGLGQDNLVWVGRFLEVLVEQRVTSPEEVKAILESGEILEDFEDADEEEQER